MVSLVGGYAECWYVIPPLWTEGLVVVGLELGGVSEGGCSGVGSSDEWEIGVRFPDENDPDTGGCSDELKADWQTVGTIDWCSEGARAELRTELVPRADE